MIFDPFGTPTGSTLSTASSGSHENWARAAGADSKIVAEKNAIERRVRMYFLPECRAGG